MCAAVCCRQISGQERLALTCRWLVCARCWRSRLASCVVCGAFAAQVRGLREVLETHLFAKGSFVCLPNPSYIPRLKDPHNPAFVAAQVRASNAFTVDLC